MFFPLVVNGRLVGICILGMTSWGKLLDAPCRVSTSSSSSPLDVITWLPVSSRTDPSSESFSECNDTDVGVLGVAEVGNGDAVSVLTGVSGMDVVRLESFLFSFRSGEAKGLSGGFVESADELCDPDLAVSLP